MHKDLEKTLVETFPELYRQYNLSAQNSCMYWGFECPDRWYFKIYELSRKITDYMKDNNFLVEAAQVKEKFGGLRFYIDCKSGSRENWNHVDKFISDAEIEIAIMETKNEQILTYWNYWFRKQNEKN